MCSEKSPHLLGPLRVIEDFPELKPNSKEFQNWFGKHLKNGGTYHPPDCIARQKVAIIVPFR
jgi:beta-1,4-galactosyltransferase 1